MLQMRREGKPTPGNVFLEEEYSLGENYSVRRLANISLTAIRFCVRLNWISLDQLLLSCHIPSLQPERNEEYLSCLLVGSEKDTWSSVCVWNQKIMAVYVLLEDWFVMSMTEKKREPRTKEHWCVLSNYLFIACVLFCLLGWFSLVLLRY